MRTGLIILFAVALLVGGALVFAISRDVGPTAGTAFPDRGATGTRIEAPGTTVESDQDKTRIEAPGVNIVVPKDRAEN